MNINEDMIKQKVWEKVFEKFLLITFTDAAAKEMRIRLAGAALEKGITIDPEKIPTMTFNAFDMDLLKKFYQDVGYAMMPTVIDVNPVREAAKILPLVTGDNQIPGLNYNIDVAMNMGAKSAQGALIVALEIFELIRSCGIDPSDPDALDDLRDACRERGIYKKVTDQSLIQLLYKFNEYNQILKSEGLITFADQEPLGIQILDIHPEYLASLGFEHIVIDEFQDSNDVNMEFVRRLEKCRDIYGGPIKSIMVIGDDAQSIYGFRNANVENMTDFENKIGSADGVTRLYMSKNYRSYSEIVDVANSLIKLNENRVEKELVAAKGNGGKIYVRGFYETDKEVETVCNKIKELHDAGREYSEMAVISFSKNTLKKYSTAFTKAGIDWIMMAPVKISENSRVKAAIALCDAFYDNDATQGYFEYLVSLYNGKIFEELTDEQINNAIETMKNEFASFESMDPNYALLKFHKYLEAIEHGDEIYRKWLDMLYDEENAQAFDPSQKLFYAVKFIQDFKRFGKNTEAKMDAKYNGVILTTAHSSKGLEYPIVFNAISDYDNAFMHNPRNKDALEERRRLLFVSMTRAMEQFYVVGQYTAYKTEEAGDIYNQFLKELYSIIDPSLKSYVPIDPNKAARDEARRLERNKKARERNAAKRDAILAMLSEDNKVYSSSDLKKSKLQTNYGQRKPSVKSRELTKEEAEEYDRLTKGASQITLADILAN